MLLQLLVGDRDGRAGVGWMERLAGEGRLFLWCCVLAFTVLESLEDVVEAGCRCFLRGGDDAGRQCRWKAKSRSCLLSPWEHCGKDWLRRFSFGF